MTALVQTLVKRKDQSPFFDFYMWCSHNGMCQILCSTHTVSEMEK
uniref:Uncharacterized protein n=1 Tax=Anguilla anguilla TaxID=7936 RepID=A0A0E9RMV3_ANGAN